MQDKAQLGNRYTCYQCGCKFYDLNRPEPTCPECSADQREAPLRDIKSILKSGKRSKKPVDDEPVKVVENDDDDLDDVDDDDDDDDALDLLGGDDDDDDDDLD
jgi:hypothetical protein